MPFITEELWARLVEVGVERDNLLCLSAWPVLEGLADAEADEEIGWLVEAGQRGALGALGDERAGRRQGPAGAGRRRQGRCARAPSSTRTTIKRLARLEDMTFAKAAPKGSAQIVLGETTAALPLAGIIDMARRAGAARARDREVAGRDQEGRRQAGQRELRRQGAARGRGGEPRAQGRLRGDGEEAAGRPEAGRGRLRHAGAIRPCTRPRISRSRMSPTRRG